MSNQEIGEVLLLNCWTVKTHIKRILGKLDAHERSQLVIAVYEAGALDRSRPSRCPEITRGQGGQRARCG